MIDESYRYVTEEGWYYQVSWEQAGYGPECGDENIDDQGPFATKEEAEEDTYKWNSPFGTGDPFFKKRKVEAIRDGKWVEIKRKNP